MVALALAFACACHGHAFAQGGEGSKRAAYRELIRKALQEYSLGHWTEARVFFEDAHAMSPNARTFRGLGMTCYEARSYVEAIGFLEQALESQVQPLTPKLASETRAILEQAKRFVSHLELYVEPENTKVSIDGKPAQRRADGTILLDPGEHELEATAPGQPTTTRTLVAEGGDPLTLHLDLRPHPAEAAASSEAAEPLTTAEPVAATPQPVPEREVQLTHQIPIAAAVSVAVGLGSIATGWMFYRARQTLRTHLYDASGPGELTTSDISTYRTQGGLALVGLAVGSSLLTLGELFWLPDDPGIPAWAWVVGGGGVAVGLAGLAIAVLGPQCDIGDARRVCQSAGSDMLLGTLVALQALPLLSLPIMYALRGRTRPQDVQVGFTWVPGPRSGPAFSLSLAF